MLPHKHLFHIDSERISSSEIWNGTAYMWRMGTAVFRVWSLYSTSYYYLKNIHRYIYHIKLQKVIFECCSMTGKRKKLKILVLWQLLGYSLFSSGGACHRGEEGEGVNYKVCQCRMWSRPVKQLLSVPLLSVFLFGSEIFSLFVLVMCPPPASQQQQWNKKRNRKEKVNVAHSQAVANCWSNLIVTQQPGAIVGSFQYRSISHSGLQSCLNMSFLNNRKQAVFSPKN